MRACVRACVVCVCGQSFYRLNIKDNLATIICTKTIILLKTKTKQKRVTSPRVARELTGRVDRGTAASPGHVTG